MPTTGTHTHLGPVTLDFENNVHQQLEFRMNSCLEICDAKRPHTAQLERSVQQTSPAGR